MPPALPLSDGPPESVEPAGAAAAAPAAAPVAEPEAPPTTDTTETAESVEPAPASAPRRREPSPNMLPARSRRSVAESLFIRIVATCGVVGIGVAIAAIMVSDNSAGWLVGLVVSIVSVVLAAVLWSSRQL